MTTTLSREKKGLYVSPAIKRRPIDTAEILAGSGSSATMETGFGPQNEPAHAKQGLWDNDNEPDEETHSTIWQ